MRLPPPGEEEISNLFKEKKKKRGSSANTPRQKKSTARKPKADIMALSPKTAQCLRDQEEEEEDDDCFLVAQERGSPDALKTNEPTVTEAVSLHRQAFSKSQTQLARCESELKKVLEVMDNIKILYVKKEGEINDLRVELTKAFQERAEFFEQLQSVKEESLARGCKIEDLKAKSAAELAKAKSDAEAIMSSYRADAEAANTRAKEIASAAEVKLSSALDHARRQSRRVTLEEVYARGLDFSADIERAKILEEEVAALLSDEDDLASGSESGGDEDVLPEGEALEDATPEDAAAEDMTPK
ncbi:uncharacterized protein [Nicotiana sylvestris]|uniref:uncharacterized protein n=1 Tax=Nicotiana sylvestris TaxID=4096 RepID=UPI00388CB599